MARPTSRGISSRSYAQLTSSPWAVAQYTGSDRPMIKGTSRKGGPLAISVRVDSMIPGASLSRPATCSGSASQAPTAAMTSALLPLRGQPEPLGQLAEFGDRVVVEQVADRLGRGRAGSRTPGAGSAAGTPGRRRPRPARAGRAPAAWRRARGRRAPGRRGWPGAPGRRCRLRLRRAVGAAPGAASMISTAGRGRPPMTWARPTRCMSSSARSARLRGTAVGGRVRPAGDQPGEVVGIEGAEPSDQVTAGHDAPMFRTDLPRIKPPGGYVRECDRSFATDRASVSRVAC